jgi:hypothetical protein
MLVLMLFTINTLVQIVKELKCRRWSASKLLAFLINRQTRTSLWMRASSPYILGRKI